VCFRTGDDESESGRRVYDIQRMPGKTGSMSQEDGKGGGDGQFVSGAKKKRVWESVHGRAKSRAITTKMALSEKRESRL